MEITSRHREAEARFRALVAEAGLEEPDTVEYAPASVTFLWHASRLAVIVDLDDAEAPVVTER